MDQCLSVIRVLTKAECRLAYDGETSDHHRDAIQLKVLVRWSIWCTVVVVTRRASATLNVSVRILPLGHCWPDVCIPLLTYFIDVFPIIGQCLNAAGDKEEKVSWEEGLGEVRLCKLFSCTRHRPHPVQCFWCRNVWPGPVIKAVGTTALEQRGGYYSNPSVIDSGTAPRGIPLEVGT